MTSLLKKILACLALAVLATSANADVIDVHFTASGSATGSGDAIFDTSIFAVDCCELPPPAYQSLTLNLNFGQGVTTFHLGDLSGTSFVLNGSGTDAANTVLSDINFWGTNSAGVSLLGVSPFHDEASGNLGANGVVVYSVASITDVPEPTSIALLSLGLFGFAALRRRKQ